MKIELHRIKIRDLVDGYVDDAESGVRGFLGLLDIPCKKRVPHIKRLVAPFVIFSAEQLIRLVGKTLADLPVGDFYQHSWRV